MLTLAGNVFDVFIAAGMAILAVLLWMVYRTMQRPRLPRRPHRRPRAGDHVAGGALLPGDDPIHGGVLVPGDPLLLSAAADERTPSEVLVAGTAVIGGARLLAHLKEEIAHELAKTVPIAILGFIIIGGGFAGADASRGSGADLPVDRFDTYWWGLWCSTYRSRSSGSGPSASDGSAGTPRREGLPVDGLPVPPVAPVAPDRVRSD